MEKKYIFTGLSKNIGEKVLHQIKAVKDIKDITAGSIGGFIEKEENLSHDGDCWIGPNVHVYNNAFIEGNARITGISEICSCSHITDNAIICDSVINGAAEVKGNAIINDATVTDFVIVKDNAVIHSGSKICDNATIDSDSIIGQNSYIGTDYNLYDKDMFKERDSRCTIVEKRISDHIVKQISYCNFVTVFNNNNENDRKPTCKLIRYIVSNPLVNIEPQICYTLKEATDMDKLLNKFRLHVAETNKAIGVGWAKHPPVVLLQGTTEHLYSFKEIRNGEYKLIHTEIQSLAREGQFDLFDHRDDIKVRSKFLTVSKTQSTNKKMLSITDWLYRR
jgi:acetyltransferase-like isoleucine patch superfamily enzyme